MSLRAAACALALLAGLTPAVAAAAAATAEAEPYRATGTAITGGADSGSAAALPPGSYVDTLDRGSDSVASTGSARWFALTVRAGQTPYVAATLVPPADVSDPANVDGTLGLQLSLSARGATSDCEQASASDFGSDDRLAPVTAVAAPGPARRAADDTGEGCPEGTLLVRVARTGEALADRPLRVEIVFRLEPAVRATTALPGPVTSAPTLQADLTGPPATLESGRSFADAPVVGSGIYRDSLGAGDTRIVRIPLAWGQHFAWSLAAGADAGAGDDDDLDVQVAVRNPVRQVAAQADESRTQAVSFGREEVTLGGATAVPVAYRNRSVEDDDVTGYALAGDYYLVVAADVPDSGDTSVSYPYTLQVEISGPTQAGPSYAPPSGAAAADSETEGSALPVAFAAGGLLLASAAVLTVVALRRDRRRQRSVHT